METGEQIETGMLDGSAMEVKTSMDLRRALAELDVGRDEFSRLADLHPVTVSRLLHNRAPFTRRTILRILAGLSQAAEQAEAEGEVSGKRHLEKPAPKPNIRRL